MNTLFAIFIILHVALFILTSGFVYLVIKNKEHTKKDWLLVAFSLALVVTANMLIGYGFSVGNDKGPILFLFLQAIPIVPIILVLLGYAGVHYANKLKSRNLRYPFFLMGAVYGANASFVLGSFLLLMGVLQ